VIDPAYLAFGQVSQGKEEIWQESARQAAEKIRLVLAAVHSPEQSRGVCIVCYQPGIVAAGQVSEAITPKIIPQPPKLDSRIAPDAGVRGAAARVFQNKMIQDLLGELQLQVNHLQGKIQLPGQGSYPFFR
jgi:hypothetical protein